MHLNCNVEKPTTWPFWKENKSYCSGRSNFCEFPKPAILMTELAGKLRGFGFCPCGPGLEKAMTQSGVVSTCETSCACDSKTRPQFSQVKPFELGRDKMGPGSPLARPKKGRPGFMGARLTLGGEECIREAEVIGCFVFSSLSTRRSRSMPDMGSCGDDVIGGRITDDVIESLGGKDSEDKELVQVQKIIVIGKFLEICVVNI